MKQGDKINWVVIGSDGFERCATSCLATPRAKTMKQAADVSSYNRT